MGETRSPKLARELGASVSMDGGGQSVNPGNQFKDDFTQSLQGNSTSFIVSHGPLGKHEECESRRQQTDQGGDTPMQSRSWAGRGSPTVLHPQLSKEAQTPVRA